VPDLATRRLHLHALTIEEATALAAGQSLAEWTFADDYPLPDTTDGVGFFLRHRDRDYGVHLVVRREDGRVIGDGGFVGPPADGAVAIGYEIVPSARRRGYATEVIRALTEWALGQPSVEEVRAETLPDNEPSIRALLGAGFVELEPGANVRRFALRGYPGLSASSSPPSES
jgi:RimJ/RimL family protein N-acetyltransferase